MSTDLISGKQKIYLFSFFWMFLVVIPVAVPYYLQLGLTMHQVFQLQALFALTMTLLEVPTGYLGDLWGRKKTLLAGSLLSALAFGTLYFAQGFWDIVVFEVLAAVGNCFVSGADVALLYDHNHEQDRRSGAVALSNLQLANQLGESTASIIGGLLASLSFKWALMANAFTSWIPLIIAFNFHEPAYEKFTASSHRKNFQEVLTHLFQNQDRLIALSFINHVLWGLSTFFAVWILQKYWQQENIALAWFGLLWAVLNLSTGLVGKLAHRWETSYGSRIILTLIMILPIVGYLGMGLTGGWLGVSFGFCFYISRGLNSVVIKDALNARTPAKFRNTMNSLASLFFRLGFALVGPAVGYGIDHQGMRFVLLALALSFSLLFFLLGRPLLTHLNQDITN